jgi:hypothetical protein
MKRTAQPSFYERRFPVQGTSTGGPLDDRIRIVNGAGALWVLAFGLRHKGVSDPDIAAIANEHPTLGPVAPSGGWTAADIAGLLNHPVLVTNLSLRDYPWEPEG